jgi:predicted transposase YbfD/YdcC
MNGFDVCFAELRDPRSSGGTRRYDILEVLMIALCAVLSGGRTAVDMAVFAEAKQEFLGRFLRLSNGVPSHNTFSRVFSQLDPDLFRACFQKFVARLGETSSGVIAIDGKTVVRSARGSQACSALHMVSAWCCDKRLVLAQIAVDTKSRERAAVLKLLEFLSVKGRIVTTDALNCQRETARAIIAGGGDYVLALKANHRRMHADVDRLIEDSAHQAADKHATVDHNHGRIETRISQVSTGIEELQKLHRWPGLAAVGKVVRIRDIAGKATTETACYLTSVALSPARLSEVARAHWGVENRLHWVLNTVMNEDQSRNRNGKTAYNLAILRHIALNLMQRDRSGISLRSKFNLAGWKDDFLAQLLAPI